MRKKLQKKHKDVENSTQKEEQETNETITTVRIKESKHNTRKK